MKTPNPSQQNTRRCLLFGVLELPWNWVINVIPSLLFPESWEVPVNVVRSRRPRLCCRALYPIVMRTCTHALIICT